MKMLLEVTGLDPLQTFSGNYGLELTSLLEVAALEGDLEMIKQLLEADKVNFHPSNKECQQALSCAIGSTKRQNGRVHGSCQVLPQPRLRRELQSHSRVLCRDSIVKYSCCNT